MSIAAASTAEPVNTDFLEKKGANLKLSDVDAAKLGEIKLPQLLHPNDFKAIESLPAIKLKNWKPLYAQAEKFQELLTLAWNEFRRQNLTKQNLTKPGGDYESPDLLVLQENHKEYTSQTSANRKGLAEVIRKIKALNKDSGDDDNLGQVSALVMRPCLDEAEWDELQEKHFSKPDKLPMISEYFSLGYSLQLIFNHGVETLNDKFDTEYVEQLRKRIRRLNISIRGLKLDMDPEKRKLGYMKIPEGEDADAFKMPIQTMKVVKLDDEPDEEKLDDEWKDDTMGSFKVPDDDDEESGSDYGDAMDTGNNGERPKVPDEIMEVYTSMGGHGGTLQRVLLANLDNEGQILDKKLAAMFQKRQDEIVQLEKEAGYSGTIFKLNIGQLKMAILKTQKAYTDLEADPGNTALQQTYRGLQEEAATYFASLGYPENFVDALAPSAQSLIDESKSRTVAELDKIMKRFGDLDGCLSRYLHSKADGKIDKDAEKKVLEIRDTIHALLGPDNPGLIDGDFRVYNFSEESLENMVNLVRMLKSEEKKHESDTDFDNIKAVGKVMETIRNTYENPITHTAIIGDIDIRASQRRLGKNKPSRETKASARPLKAKPFSPSSKKRQGETIAAPTDEDFASDIMQTNSDPTVVLDVTGEQSIEKKILFFKRISRKVNINTEDEHVAVVGYHLVLKYHDAKRYKYPSYEMVPGSTHPGAAQQFRNGGGEELQPGTKDDLLGFKLADLRIAGVMPVGRAQDLDKDLNQSQKLMLRMYFVEEKKYMFFYITTLRDKFGQRPIDVLRDLYAAGSGQKLAVAVSRADERKAYKARIDELMGKKPSTKSKVPFSRRRPMVSVRNNDSDDNNNSDDIGDSIDIVDSNGSGSENEDNGDEDLEDFVVPDTGDSEEVANKNEELLSLKEELDILVEEEESTTVQLRKATTKTRRNQIREKLEMIKSDIEDTNDGIASVMKALAILKENEAEEPDNEDEITQIKANIKDAKRRGQTAKVKMLERRLARLRL